MKNWSLSKILLVAGGGFFGVIVFSVIAINILTQSKTDVSNPSSKRKIGTSHVEASNDFLGPDIVSVQLESAQSALREARQETKNLEQKLKVTFDKRDEQIAQIIASLNEELQKTNKRLVVLEEAMSAPADVAIVRSERFTGTADVSTAAAKVDQYSPPPGFNIRAEVGDRVWLSDGNKEISILKSQQKTKD